MPHHSGSPADPPPPEAVFANLTQGIPRHQRLYVMAKLGIADVLRAGPKTSAEVAPAVGAHPDALHRLLRALVLDGLLLHEPDGRFSLTAVGQMLASDRAGGVARAYVLETVEVWGPVWADLLETVRTGEPAFDRVYGMGFYEYLERHPERGANRTAQFARGAAEVAPAFVAAYDFPAMDTVVDVGGGTGALLAEVLRAHPGLRGVLFDQPHVVAGAAPVLAAAGVAERCRMEGGDLLTVVPAGGDIYLLSLIIHNWDEAHALAILRNCRTVLAEGARLVLLEALIPDRITAPQRPSAAVDPVQMDMSMLVMLRGRERTEVEYRDLFAAADLRLARVIPMASRRMVVAIEAVPV